MPNFIHHTEEQLLEAIRIDNEKAFAELFRRYWRKAHGLAHSKVHSKEVAEEIVQDLFITLWNKRATLQINNFSSYLYTTVKNRSLNYIEACIVREKYWTYYKAFVPQFEESTEKAVAYDELVEAIENEMNHLPEKSKKVFRLNRLEGRSIPEIATALNLSEKAIEYHITRSLKQLRLHLKDYILSIIAISYIFE
ncbi:MAG: RNA polymerase sigma-70 factor [Chryseolinea sp.]